MMLPVREGVTEYLKLVFRRWWFGATGILAGVLWLASLIVSIPAIPRWVWVVAFAGLLFLAQFLAFSDVRNQRDDTKRRLELVRPAPTLSLLRRPTFWTAAVLRPDGAGGRERVTATDFDTDPADGQITFSGDLEAAAYGGAKGGVLHDVMWSVRNLPFPMNFRPPDILSRPIALAPNQNFPFKERITFIWDGVHLSKAEDELKAIDSDPILVATYRHDGSNELEATLILPRADLLTAFRYSGARGLDAPPSRQSPSHG